MRRNLKTILFGALCSAFLFGATAPGSAGPVSVGVSREVIGSMAPVQEVRAAHPATGRHCLKWRRTWNPRHGVAHRRCVHWR